MDFIIHSARNLLQKHFAVDLNNGDVEVLDIGGGEFLIRLFELGLLDRMSEKHESYIRVDKPMNQHRSAREDLEDRRTRRVRVIIGSPPYSASWAIYGNDNQSISDKYLNARINDTYLAQSRTHHKASLYDSYIRSLRWASDRLGDAGIIAVITNAGFLRSEAGAGIRASLAAEFNEIWCFDLRGNARTLGGRRRKEGGGVLGEGFRASAAIMILIKNPCVAGTTIRYRDIGDYLTREQKMDILKKHQSVDRILDWQIILPDKHHDWLDQRLDSFTQYVPMGDRDVKHGESGAAVFKTYSSGVCTSRDSWMYNSSKPNLAHNITRMTDHCNKQNLDNPTIDPKLTKWDAELCFKLRRLGCPVYFDSAKIRLVMYRPFFKQYLYFDQTFNRRLHLTPEFFPECDSVNLVICVSGKSTDEFSVFVTDITPDARLLFNTQCFPLFIYDKDGRHDNISDSTLSEYETYHKSVTKRDLFYYVYGILHHLGYRKKFTNNLTRELPRIPMAPDFEAFSDAGRQLAYLHLGYETCKRHDLGKPKFVPTKFTKLSFGWKSDAKKRFRDCTIIRADGAVLFDNLPETSYRVNGRTPVEWIVDRYRVTTDEESGIVNDPCTGTDIVTIIERAVHVGLESERIIANLPSDFEP